MKKWTKISVGAAMVMLVMAATWCCWPDREPAYKGKRVREWAGVWAFSGHAGNDGEEALKYFGTNTIPYVRAGLRARDTWQRRLLLWAKARAPWLKIRVYPAWQEREIAMSLYIHILASGVWGDATAACAPEVRALMNDPHPQVSSIATSLLDFINQEESKHGPALKVSEPRRL